MNGAQKALSMLIVSVLIGGMGAVVNIWAPVVAGLACVAIAFAPRER